MKESVTYQAIVEEGRREGALAEIRKVLLRVGQHQFGAPAPDDIRITLEGTHDLEQLEQLTERVLEVDSWEALLTPPRKRSRRRRNGS